MSLYWIKANQSWSIYQVYYKLKIISLYPVLYTYSTILYPILCTLNPTRTNQSKSKPINMMWFSLIGSDQIWSGLIWSVMVQIWCDQVWLGMFSFLKIMYVQVFYCVIASDGFDQLWSTLIGYMDIPIWMYIIVIGFRNTF